MEEQIYRIVRIDEEDFGCEGRPEGQMPMVRVLMEADTGETAVVMMEDSLMYARELDVGGFAVIGMDGMLYQPGKDFTVEQKDRSEIDFDKQADWMGNYWDALDELNE